MEGVINTTNLKKKSSYNSTAERTGFKRRSLVLQNECIDKKTPKELEKVLNIIKKL